MLNTRIVVMLMLGWVSVANAEDSWFRGNTHTHTVLCGHADSTPEYVANWYLARGYNFLILSEHNQFIDPAIVKLPENRRKDFMLIPGLEITGVKHIHTTAMNVHGVVDWKFDSKEKSAIIQNHIEGTRAAGGEAVLNHPNFHYAVSVDDMSKAKDMRMFELFNGHKDSNGEGDNKHLSTERIWDALLTQGKWVYGVSSDDAHEFQKIGPNASNPGRGWVMVKAPVLEADAIVRAMQKGDFYSSNGVFLKTCQRGAQRYAIGVDIGRTEQELTTLKDLRGKYSDKASEGCVIEFIGPEGKVLKSVNGTEASYSVESSTAYVRAKVSYTRKHPNQQGYETYFAWAQPVFTDGRDKR